jgi:hypothetical protein
MPVAHLLFLGFRRFFEGLVSGGDGGWALNASRTEKNEPAHVGTPFQSFLAVTA